jgi:hypothetical protein
MSDHLYRVRITEYPSGALIPIVEGKPSDCEVAWVHDPNWTPPGWKSAQKRFYWPEDGKPYHRQSTAERLARLLQSYGATVVVERSSEIVWPDNPGLPQRL